MNLFIFYLYLKRILQKTLKLKTFNDADFVFLVKNTDSAEGRNTQTRAKSTFADKGRLILVSLSNPKRTTKNCRQFLLIYIA